MEHYKNLDLADIVYFCEFDKVWKTEEWKDVIGYENHYQVSDLGRVKSLKYFRTNKALILKSCFTGKGYLLIGFYLDGKFKTFKIHKLVSIAFLEHIPCGMELVVNHKNFIKTDNRKLNLEIITNRLNCSLIEKKTSSKYTGVYWHKKNSTWIAGIKENGKRRHIGCFKNELEASKAYQNALKPLK